MPIPSPELSSEPEVPAYVPASAAADSGECGKNVSRESYLKHYPDSYAYSYSHADADTHACTRL